MGRDVALFGNNGHFFREFVFCGWLVGGKWSLLLGTCVLLAAVAAVVVFARLRTTFGSEVPLRHEIFL